MEETGMGNIWNGEGGGPIVSLTAHHNSGGVSKQIARFCHHFRRKRKENKNAFLETTPFKPSSSNSWRTGTKRRKEKEEPMWAVASAVKSIIRFPIKCSSQTEEKGSLSIEKALKECTSMRKNGISSARRQPAYSTRHSITASKGKVTIEGGMADIARRPLACRFSTTRPTTDEKTSKQEQIPNNLRRNYRVWHAEVPCQSKRHHRRRRRGRRPVWPNGAVPPRSWNSNCCRRRRRCCCCWCCRCCCRQHRCRSCRCWNRDCYYCATPTTTLPPPPPPRPTSMTSLQMALKLLFKHGNKLHWHIT